MSKPVIAIIGATGAQGGGLARAIQQDPQSPFSVRALTRQPQSAAALALKEAGAELSAANLDDEESLTQAFQGAHGLYAVTNFWEHFSPDRELAQAKNIAAAARRAGVKHVIWSTLEDTRRFVPLDDPRMPTLQGRYKVPHFDTKGEANRFFTEMNVPTTFLVTSFYWDNFIHFGMGPKRGADGQFAITLPMGSAKLPGIAVEDIGKTAYSIFKRGAEYIGKTVGIAGEHLTGAQMAAALSAALGQPVSYNNVSPEVYRGLGFPGAEDLGNMFQFKRDFEQSYCAARDVVATRALNPSLQTFRQWLEQNVRRIPLDA